MSDSDDQLDPISEKARIDEIRRKQREAIQSSDDSDSDSDNQLQPQTQNQYQDSSDDTEITHQPPIKKAKHTNKGNQFVLSEAVDVDSSEDEFEEQSDDNDIIDNLSTEKNDADQMYNVLLEQQQNQQFNRTEDFVDKLMHKYDVDDEKSVSSLPSGTDFSTANLMAGRTDNMTEIERFNPTIRDPNIWYVKCKYGDEKLLAFKLIKKAIKCASEGRPLQIKSVISPDYLRGYICIEAFKKPHLISAIEGINGLNQGIYNNKLIKRTEMTDILKVGTASVREEIKIDSWVRFTRGEFKDDLAKVDYVDNSSGMVTLQIIPRIDYTRLRSKATKKFFKKKRGRPTQKLFDEDRITALGGDCSGRENDFILFESRRYRNGYLFKDYRIDHITTENVNPTLAELEKFEDSVEDMRLDRKLDSDDKSTKLSVGDYVIAIEGELINLEGKVISINVTNDTVTIMPKNTEINEPLEFKANELMKHFKTGDHIKVINGKYTGDTGLIVSVINEQDKPTQAIVISDVSTDEMIVLTKDIIICKEVSSGVDSIGRFSFGDLVEIDTNIVGVIVRLEKEHLHILNQYQKVQKFRHAAISRRKRMGRAMALDRDGNALQVKGIVKVIDGQHRGTEASIKHLFRQFLFLHSKKVSSNGGMFVARSKHCQLVGGGKGVIIGETANYPGIMMSPRLLSSPSHPSQSSTTPSGLSPRQGGTKVNMPNANDPSRNRAFIHKTCRIRAGAYKGYIGIIKDAHGAAVRVELHSSVKTINVDKNNIRLIDHSGKAKTGITPFNSVGKTPIAGTTGTMQTPMYQAQDGIRTPMYETGKTPNPYDPSKTPMYGSMTPRNDGGQSAWDPNVTNTPFMDEPFENSGPRTPGTHGHTNYEASPMPSPGLGNTTPGYMDTPGNNYTTFSPGNIIDQPVPSPVATGSFNAPSPVIGGGNMPNSPMFHNPSPNPSGSYHTSPIAPNIAPSPMAPSPGTYNVNSPYSSTYSTNSTGNSSNSYSPGQLQQPGSNPQNFPMPSDLIDWCTDDILAKVKDNYEGEDTLRGELCIIRSVVGSNLCNVYMLKDGQIYSIDGRQLHPVTPSKDDKVKVIQGEDRDNIGTLISIDGDDGIVRMDNDKQLKILQLRFLAKYRSQDDVGNDG